MSVNEMNGVAQLGEPTSMHSGAAAHVKNGGRRCRQESSHQFVRALMLEFSCPRAKTLHLVSRRIVVSNV